MSDNPSFPCQFGGATITEVGKLKLSISRSERLGPEDADKYFNGKRLDLSIRVVPQGTDEDPDQGKLMNGHAEIRTTVDIKGYRAVPDAFGIGLTFDLEEHPSDEICAFAKKQGRIEIHNVEEIPEKTVRVTSDPAQQDLPIEKEGSAVFPAKARPKAGEVDEGATLPISYLAKPVYGLTKAFCEKVEQAVGPTIGHLILKMRRDEMWYRDLKGVGEVGLNRLIDALARFRQDFPQPEEYVALASEKEAAVETAEALP